MRVLFVDAYAACKGPIAEALFRRYADPKHKVFSVGLAGIVKEGDNVPALVCRVMEQIDINMEPYYSRPFKPELLKGLDLAVSLLGPTELWKPEDLARKRLLANGAEEKQYRLTSYELPGDKSLPVAHVTAVRDRLNHYVRQLTSFCGLERNA